MSKFLKELNSLFIELFNDPNISINPSTNAKDIEGWDSLMHVRIILGIELKFNVQFSASEASSFANVGDILSALEEKSGY